tara:strand:- start:557 stop:763 length:207 start_codon:yes stop_codon:yes gene_type:complete
MMSKENQTYQTPIEDLRKDNLNHYEEASSSIHHWSSGVPRAINFYYDYLKMSRWDRIKLAFKIKPKQR